jgi:hypothetical protein
MFSSEAHAEDLKNEEASRVSTMGLLANKALQTVQIEINHTKGLRPMAPRNLGKRKPLKTRITRVALLANKALTYSIKMPSTSAKCLHNALPEILGKEVKNLTVLVKLTCTACRRTRP